jgi:murein DD-endopeptidase MepM/ murein hydrolase activator NlpD
MTSLLKQTRGILASGLLLALIISLLFPFVSMAQEGYVLPFEGRTNVTAGPGDIDTHKFGPSSEAIDFDLDYGTSVYPTKPGVVIEVMWSNIGYGNRVKVRHDDRNVSLYAHLSSISVNEEQRVGYGDKLGEVGNSGNVYPKPNDCPRRPYCGDHLHFEVRNPSETHGVSVRYLVDWNPGCPPCDDRIKGSATGSDKPPPNGRWEGILSQIKPNLTYPMTMVLENCSVGTECGSTFYDMGDIGTCEGALTLVVVNGDNYEFYERVTLSNLIRYRCVDAKLVLHPISELSWYMSTEPVYHQGDEIGVNLKKIE